MLTTIRQKCFHQMPSLLACDYFTIKWLALFLSSATWSESNRNYLCLFLFFLAIIWLSSCFWYILIKFGFSSSRWAWIKGSIWNPSCCVNPYFLNYIGLVCLLFSTFRLKLYFSNWLMLDYCILVLSNNCMWFFIRLFFEICSCL